MTAYTSGNYITVGGSGNTLASITADINDASFIEEVTPDYYLVKDRGSSGGLTISTGGELTIGDPTDFSVTESLVLENLTSNRQRFYVYAGGICNVYGNTELILASGSTTAYGGTTYNYGEFIMSGSSEYPVTFWGFRDITQDANSVLRWNYVNVGKSSYRYGYMLSIKYPSTMSISNCNLNTGIGAIPIYDARGNHQTEPIGHHTLFIDNCDFTNMAFPTCILDPAIKITNSTFSVQNLNQYVTPARDPLGFSWIHGSTFTNDSGSDDQYVFEGSLMNNLIESSSITFSPTTRILSGLNVGGPSQRFMFKHVSFTSASYEKYSGTATYAVEYVNRLTVTVVDSTGSPVENARIAITQIDDYEAWSFKTNSSGQIDVYGYPWLLCTHYRKYGDYPLFYYDYKSDAVNGGGHNIVVIKAGYATYNKTVYVSEDREVDIILQPLPKRHTNKSYYNKIR